MQRLYECTVRLNGEMKNEVRKTNVTAAEIAVLKAIHGGKASGVEAVYQIKATGSAKRDDAEERGRLATIYAHGLAKHGYTFDQILGFHTVPLPQTITGVDALPAPKTGRRAKVEPIEPEVKADDEPEQIEQSEFA